MSIDVLKKGLKENKFESIYLFSGEEILLKEYYFKKIKELIVSNGMESFNYYMFTGKDNDISLIEDAFESMPVMSDRKLIYIKDSEIFKSAKSIDVEYWEKILNDVPEYTYVIFDEKNIDKRNKLFKVIKKVGTIVEFKQQKSHDLVNWTGRLTATYGKKISKEDILYLLEHCDEGMINIKNEVIKLSNYCKGDIITRSDIDDLCIKSVESKVFSLMDALMENNMQKAFEMIENMKILKEPVIKILSILAKQLSQVLKVKLMLEKGATNVEIGKTLKLAGFIVKKYINYARRFSINVLNTIIKECSDADINIKTGQMGEWLAFELLVLNLKR